MIFFGTFRVKSGWLYGSSDLTFFFPVVFALLQEIVSCRLRCSKKYCFAPFTLILLSDLALRFVLVLCAHFRCILDPRCAGFWGMLLRLFFPQHAHVRTPPPQPAHLSALHVDHPTWCNFVCSSVYVVPKHVHDSLWEPRYGQFCSFSNRATTFSSCHAEAFIGHAFDIRAKCPFYAFTWDTQQKLWEGARLPLFSVSHNSHCFATTRTLTRLMLVNCTVVRVLWIHIPTIMR